MNFSTGNAIVDAVAEMNLTGNVIPVTWFKTIVKDSGKPNLNAIIILSDIVYWYRPKEERDEETGAIIGFRKKFRADLLQRSYRQIMDQFGLSRKMTRVALDDLCKLGVLVRHLRNDKTKDGAQLHNNMYLELVPEVLRALTYPQSIDEVVPSREPPCALEDTTVATHRTEGNALEGTTSTKNTTKNSTRDYHPIYQPDEMEVITAYTDIIKENIEYSALVQEHGQEKIDEIVDLLVETVAIETDSVWIGGKKHPYQLVKGKLLKIDYSHVQYAIECMKKNTTKVKNIRKYLLTTLYNAPSTIDHYYQSEVNHDMYGCD